MLTGAVTVLVCDQRHSAEHSSELRFPLGVASTKGLRKASQAGLTLFTSEGYRRPTAVPELAHVWFHWTLIGFALSHELRNPQDRMRDVQSWRRIRVREMRVTLEAGGSCGD